MIITPKPLLLNSPFPVVRPLADWDASSPLSQHNSLPPSKFFPLIHGLINMADVGAMFQPRSSLPLPSLPPPMHPMLPPPMHQKQTFIKMF